MTGKRRNYIGRILLYLLVVVALAACGTTEASEGDGKLNVVATTGQIADALQNIGGDAINLTGLLGPGVDPHLYVPTEGDVRTLSRADMIVYNGLHLEAQMERVLVQLGTRGKTVVAVGDSLPEERLLDWDSSAPHDPHIWNDPQLWSLTVETMRDALIEADSANAELYRANADAYLQEIAETDQYIGEQLERVPPERRVMITAHDAFGYFARAYGFEVAGLQGISTEAEASVGDIQELGDLIVERRIPAVFVETSVSPRNIEALQAYVRDQGFELVIGGSLYSDALGAPDTPEGTYTGMLRHNAKTLADALSGEQPTTDN
jgi:manganese/zinc/iron transport system substrate-binding protein